MINLPRRALWEFLTLPSNFGDPDRTCVSAKGVRVSTLAGRELLCGTSGLWNTIFGYGNPHVTEAITRQLESASYLGLFGGGNTVAAQAAEELILACGPETFGRVIFATSGSSANDLLIKVARQVSQLRGDRSRKLIVGLRGSYHGMTYGALSLTGQDLGQDVFAVDRRYIRHVDPFDGGQELRDLCEAEGDRIALLVLEPVLGTGALEVPGDFILKAGALSDQYGFLIAADEVATGYHRTGPFRASNSWDKQPDLLVLSKGLTNGTCAAAVVIVSHDVCDLYDEHDAPLVHGETQAGTPPSSAAIIATLAVAQEFAKANRPKEVSNNIAIALDKLVASANLSLELSGVGCFRGVIVRPDGLRTLTEPEVASLVKHVRTAGAIVQPGLGGLQLVPSLVYQSEDIEELLSCLGTGIRMLERDLR